MLILGLEAVQQPLRERYPFDSDGDVPGIDSWLTVFSSGIAMQYVSDMATVTWFPISSMHVSAAVKVRYELLKYKIITSYEDKITIPIHI